VIVPRLRSSVAITRRQAALRDQLCHDAQIEPEHQPQARLAQAGLNLGTSGKIERGDQEAPVS
jgi:hypothetical protein